MINFYEKSVEIIGELPPQYEIIYALFAILLIIGFFLVLFSPVFFLRAVSGR